MNLLNQFQSSVNNIEIRHHHGTVLQSIGLVIEAACPGVFVGGL